MTSCCFRGPRRCSHLYGYRGANGFGPGTWALATCCPPLLTTRRLTPAYFSTEDEDEAAMAFEFGLGRERVMSREGRLEAVDRWYAGDPGPRAEVARTAPASCATCGFYLPLAGTMRQAFGACANEFAPDDGKVVAVDHGCGAHSEAIVVPVSPPPPPPLIDEAGYDIVEPAAPGEIVEVEVEVEVEDSDGSIDVAELSVAAPEGGSESVEPEDDSAGA